MQFIRQYFFIFGILIISSAFLIDPARIDRNFVLLSMTFAAVGDLPLVVFWSRSELSEKSLRIRTILHFILLEAVILMFGGITGIVPDLKGYIIFGLEVAVIYLLVKLISWRGDVRTADKINEKLKSMKNTGDDE